MKDLDVKCPNCKRVYHSTSETFDPEKSPNGGMVRLKDPWRKWKWGTFDDGRDPKAAERETVPRVEMTCPGCGSYLAPNGSLTVLNQDGTLFTGDMKEMPLDTTEELKAKIGEMKDSGLTFLKIGEELGIPWQTAVKIHKEVAA